MSTPTSPTIPPPRPGSSSADRRALQLHGARERSLPPARRSSTTSCRDARFVVAVSEYNPRSCDAGIRSTGPNRALRRRCRTLPSARGRRRTCADPLRRVARTEEGTSLPDGGGREPLPAAPRASSGPGRRWSGPGEASTRPRARTDGAHRDARRVHVGRGRGGARGAPTCSCSPRSARDRPDGGHPRRADGSDGRGVPVVATRLSGIPELVSADTGMLVEPNDSGGLADAIERLLDDCDLARRCADGARARVVSRFDLFTEAQRLGDLSRASLSTA